MRIKVRLFFLTLVGDEISSGGDEYIRYIEAN